VELSRDFDWWGVFLHGMLAGGDLVCAVGNWRQSRRVLDLDAWLMIGMATAHVLSASKHAKRLKAK
jgi:hypothetical protein